jgi:N-acyl-D-amino-acid deacylase
MSAVIRNARIVDGTGTPAYDGEVLIEAERIVAVSREAGSLQGDLEVNASGLVLAPGFINDISHTLRPLFILSRRRSCSNSETQSETPDED